MMIRREAAEDVGLLDERFFLHGEDLEWCWRMRSAGWSIGLCTAAIAKHRGWTSSSATFASDEIRRRMARGGMEAVRMARGARYARTFALAMEIRHAIEARHPRRNAKHRDLSREWVEAWRTARHES